MRQDVIQRLLDLNHEFYQTFAGPFSETRQRLQPGVVKAIKDIPLDTSVLDLGCGNGLLGKELYKAGHRGQYYGIDSGKTLLAEAQENNIHPNATFVELDLAKDSWSSTLPGSFDRVFAFAVLHHIPSHDLRKKVIKTIASLIGVNGFFIFSVWKFLSNPRFKKRIIPWNKVDLHEDQLEEGDYVLDWKREGYGVRYVHSFRTKELQSLAHNTGFEVVESYRSDGEDGKSGEYHIWKPASA